MFSAKCEAAGRFILYAHESLSRAQIEYGIQETENSAAWEREPATFSFILSSFLLNHESIDKIFILNLKMIWRFLRIFKAFPQNTYTITDLIKNLKYN